MRAAVHSPDNLDWTVKRLWVLHRPTTPAQALDEGLDTTIQGWYNAPGLGSDMGEMYPLGAVVLDTLLFLASLPFLPFSLVLRRRGVLPWEIEARCRPWGRQGPPWMMRWRVRGGAESRRAFQEIVDQLGKGTGAPVVAGAERVG